MKTKINALIVLEGKSDISFLSSFIDADFYSVNGSAISAEDISFIKEVKKRKDIVVLTDPDYPGTKIRNRINNEIPGLKNAFVRKEFSIKKNKVGVAECDKEEVLKSLSSLITYDKQESIRNITILDLMELELSGCEKAKNNRKIITDRLGIGFSNSKTLLSKLNMIGITKSELERVLENAEYNRNN